MDKSQINAKIREKEKAIDNYEADIRQLKRKLDDLDDLLRRLASYRNDFTQAQATRMSMLRAVSNWAVNTRITNPYSMDMGDRINGQKHRNALGELDTAKRLLNNKNDAIEEEIERLKRKIRNYEKDITDLKKLL